MPNLSGSDLGSEILIVEDTRESMALLSDIMTGAGYVIRQAQDGEMALLSVRSKVPDLILLDVRLPGIDGFEVCRRLKASPETATTPIIFLSALQDSEARVKGLQAGAADYICKPYEPTEVLLRVRTNLELHLLQMRLQEMCDIRTQQLLAEVAERRNAEDELRTSRQKLRELTGHLQDVREKERARIAREIHDELGQALTAIKIDLTRMLARLDQPASQLKPCIDDIINVVDTAANTARAISENLRPGMLDLLGLGPAIEHHVQRFGETTGLTYSLYLDNEGELGRTGNVATAAFRITQEALTNVARHAHATRVDVSVRDTGSALIVTVQDNGDGILPAPAGQQRGRYGLLGMSERCQLLGGTLSIESSPGEGTRVVAQLPYDKPLSHDESSAHEEEKQADAKFANKETP